MAINRGPFNALIDDDGSGLTGSIWNKAAIQNVLLDPIDAQPTFQDVPFNAANFRGNGSMTWTVGAAAVINNRYAMIGNTLMIWSFYISWFSGANVLGGTPSTAIEMVLPGGKYGKASTFALVTYSAGIAGVPIHAGIRIAPNDAPGVQLVKADGSNYALTDVPGFVTTVILEVF